MAVEGEACRKCGSDEPPQEVRYSTEMDTKIGKNLELSWVANHRALILHHLCKMAA